MLLMDKSNYFSILSINHKYTGDYMIQLFLKHKLAEASIRIFFDTLQINMNSCVQDHIIVPDTDITNAHIGMSVVAYKRLTSPDHTWVVQLASQKVEEYHIGKLSHNFMDYVFTSNLSPSLTCTYNYLVNMFGKDQVKLPTY